MSNSDQHQETKRETIHLGMKEDVIKKEESTMSEYKRSMRGKRKQEEKLLAGSAEHCVTIIKARGLGIVKLYIQLN